MAEQNWLKNSAIMMLSDLKHHNAEKEK